MRVRKQRSSNCSFSRQISTGLLCSLLSFAAPVFSILPPAVGPVLPEQPSVHSNSHGFSLRHVFHRGTYQDPTLHKRMDIRPTAQVLLSSYDDPPRLVPPPHFSAQSRSIQIERLSDRRPEVIESHLYSARMTGQAAILGASQWQTDELPGPNVTDKETVINLALMAANAYAIIPGEGEWTNISMGYNQSQSFGWEGDGLRGHIFADEGNATIIVSLKGTSPAVFDGDGTTTKDKLNDNLFFSCCCAQGGQYFWRQVCDCYSNTYSCNQTCLISALKRENRYYRAAIDLYTNVTELYPDSDVWLVGHSLGGAVSSLLGLTFGLPVVTFEAPGDDLAARRLGLPRPPNSDPDHPFQRRNTGSFQFGHTADPVFMGTCNGATATCTLGGYAMESQCHTGLQCVYDTVGDYGWRVGIGYHKIHEVIDNVIAKYPKVAECIPDNECVDCFNWKYFNSNGSDTTKSSTTQSYTSTRTRTTTCKTPGWWGCLDETTPSSTSTTTSVLTTTYTTTSCATPGWFGCKELVTTTITTTTTAPLSTKSGPASGPATTTATCSSSAACEQPGWFGCKDPSPTSISTSSVSTPTASYSCESPGLFFGCHDRSTSDTRTTSFSTTAAPSTTAAEPTGTKKPKDKCKHPAFFGLICVDSAAEPGTQSEDGFGEWNSEL